MLAYATECGVDARALIAEVGIDPAVLRDPDSRVSLRLLHRAWELAAARSGDPAFGLHAGEHAGLGTFEALDYAMWASDTLEDVLERLVRFYRVIGDDLATTLVRKGDWIHLRHVSTHEPRHRAETRLAVLASRARELCGRGFRIHEVRFRHPAPADARPHRALFRCPVQFGCATTELVFAAEQLQLPVRTAKPGLASVLDRHLQVLLGRLPKEPTLLARVDDAIARLLHVGRPSLARTAVALQVAPRTLQRELQRLDLTHRKVVDDLRRELADRYLAARRISISEVAFMLGFNDVSGFRRAYRKWTGRNASQARRR
jgi:AraC-like DNA-binding protein